MTLCLDTNVLIDVLRRRHPTKDRYAEWVASDEPAVISVLTMFELLYGANKSRRPAWQESAVRFLLRGIGIEPLTEADVAKAAQLQGKLAGKKIGPYDILIAGQAFNRGWTLVTSNVGEFSRVNGLAVENWSASET